VSRRDDVARTLAQRQTANVEALARRSGQTVRAMFLQLEALDDDALERWLRAVVPVAQGIESAAATSGIGYVRSLSTVYGHTVGDVAPVDEIIGPALRSGTTYVDEWTRPVVTSRAAIARGRTWLEALDEGAAKAANLARTDVGLASRAGSTAAMKSTPAVTGYRRVPDSSPCAFCLTISTRRYNVDTLAPVHANCTCGVVPIYSNGDPGAAISADARQKLDETETLDVSTSEIGPVTATTEGGT
jgi:hypothetical protein